MEPQTAALASRALAPHLRGEGASDVPTSEGGWGACLGLPPSDRKRWWAGAAFPRRLNMSGQGALWSRPRAGRDRS